MTIHNALNQSGIDLKLKLMKMEETVKFLSEFAREVNDEERHLLEKAESVISKYLESFYSAQVRRVKELGLDPENP